MTDVSPEQLLPHRAPFLFVDTICTLGDGAVRATWTIRGDEDFLRGHFPDDAIIPGVLIGEALAQAAGIALTSLPGEGTGPRRPGFLAHINLRFHAPARPPCQIELTAKVSGGMGSLHQFDVTAHSHSERLASGILVLAVPPTTGAET